MPGKSHKNAVLVLADGSIFHGAVFAGDGEALGEVIFNTGMTGYQEILTDPSYKGQIVVMTSPMIGNTGINPEDMESAGIHLEGFVVREYEDMPSNWRSRQTLRSFLESHGKLGIDEIDTRALTRHIRSAGAMGGIISTRTADTKRLLERVREYPGLVGRDLVSEVTGRFPYVWKNGMPETMRSGKGLSAGRNASRRDGAGSGDAKSPGEKNRALRVVVLDCGVKYSILRNLEKRGCDVLVFPAATSAEEILSLKPDGVLLSNGPGDPAALGYIVETVKRLVGKVPIFGICLGHQLLGQAVGGKTAKLKFGHHGLNQPVYDVKSAKVSITSQNHGFIVLPESLFVVMDDFQQNLNDRTSEALYYPDIAAFSVQYHPEAAPGPHDASFLFDEFVRLMEREGNR